MARTTQVAQSGAAGRALEDKYGWRYASFYVVLQLRAKSVREASVKVLLGRGLGLSAGSHPPAEQLSGERDS